MKRAAYILGDRQTRSSGAEGGGGGLESSQELVGATSVMIRFNTLHTAAREWERGYSRVQERGVASS